MLRCENRSQMNTISGNYQRSTISDFLGSDHERCDDLFAQVDLTVTQANWDAAEAAFQRFVLATERHFKMEEEVLFPAFEQTTGNSNSYSAGPTSVMRMEHRQLRVLVRFLSEALARQDGEEFFGHADTLRIMLHQHNQKEENVLYLMTDRVLSTRREELINAMLGTDVAKDDACGT
jgi:hemerythrin-like domain-containing protein